MVTTNIAANGTTKTELVAANPGRRAAYLYNPGPSAMDVYIGTSLVAMMRLFEFGFVSFVTANQDPTDAILGQLVTDTTQNIAVTK